MKKAITLTLQELYNSSKITASVEDAIKAKENFSRVQYEYCNKICKLKCKSFEDVRLDSSHVDILIVQDHAAIRDGYKSASRIEDVHKNIIEKLCEIHFSDLTYRLTNALKCQLRDEDLVKGKPPSVVVQSKCHPYLQKEVDSAKPRVIISLGSNATKALGYTKKSNYTNRGEILDGKVVLTLHPKITTMIRQNSSGAMWGPDYWEVISNDFAKAAKLARGELVIGALLDCVQDHKQNIWVTRSMEDVLVAASEILSLSSSKVISFDTETTGLDRYADDAKLLCIQFGYKTAGGVRRAIVIPLWHRENKYYDPNLAWDYVKEILVGPQPKIAHNGKYDILYIYETTKVRVKNLMTDTMLALHNLNSGAQGCYGLKVAVWDHLPDLGLSGYEDLLPKLTKPSKEEPENATEVE